MKKTVLTLLCFITSIVLFAQTEERIRFVSVTPSEETGQDYSPWLNDNTDSLVAQAWTNNFKWVDVTLKLEKKALISRLSFFDAEGVFSDKPASIYAVNGTEKILLGTFEGPTYMTWIDMPLAQAVFADAIVIHKYSNNIPQKIKAFGRPITALSAFTPVPGRVEAESFAGMNGIQTENTADAGGGQNVGWIDDNDWMDYHVKVASAGVYTLKFRIANGWGNGQIELKTFNGTVLTTLSVPQTGGLQAWQTISTTAYLNAGEQILRLKAVAGNWNFNWFQVEGALPVPGKIEAETFSGMSGIQTETTSDAGGGLNVGRIDDNDWLDYNVNVASAGPYAFHFRVAKQYGDGKIEVRTAAGTVLTTVDIPYTGGWQSFSTVSGTATLPAGNQILRIYAVKGDWNFNWVDVQTTAPVAVPSVITFAALSDKTVGDAPFNLTASSNNTETAITFASSNSAVVSVSNSTGSWKATVTGAGTATITASQTGNANFIAASNVTRTLVVQPAPTTPPTSSTAVKIPIEAKRWYQLNNVNNGLEGLFDGVTNVDVNTGYGKVLSNFDAYYPLQPGETMTIESIKFFDGSGMMTDNPMTLSVITDQWQIIPIATFTGQEYNGWVGPYPTRPTTGDAKFRLDVPISNARYLVLNAWWGYPTEMELYGSYTPTTVPVTPIPQKSIQLKSMFGANAFEWDFEDGRNPDIIDETKMKAVKTFRGIRHYMDWEKLEANEGKFTYNPTHSGGWNYDAIYERCKAEGIEVLACLKTLPGWMLATYPEDQRDSENVPLRFGSDFTNPASYIDQAKVAFQYMARYGSNPNVNPALVSVNSTPRWTGDPVNTVKIGLGLIKYIECDNERDKWWKGRKGYQTAREYAANLSAFYDGHKNTMGPGVGVKNADPNVKVVIGGMASAYAGPDYLLGMIDWCKQYRGYKPDGTVNLCWDVINYHLYPDNSNSSQSGTSSRGAAPEISSAVSVVQKFVEAAHKYAYDMPVWVTETGYDANQGSPLKAIPIGDKNEYQTQADWILRTALFYARSGVERVFFYQMYDDNFLNPTQFGSSGLINQDFTRKPAADFIFQANKLLGEYTYKQTISTNPIVDRYEYQGKSAYVLVVPDEVGRTASYTLNLGTAVHAKVYTPKMGRDTADVQTIPTVAGKVTLTVTETPIFVIASDQVVTSATSTTATARLGSAELTDQSLNQSVRVYPNPSVDVVTVDVANENAGPVEINVFSGSMGTLHKQVNGVKSSGGYSREINVSTLPVGMYILEIKQGTERTFRKVLKANK
ncbi:carbohydrate-binding protein [Larkinella humicola]|uniref:Carbohydrate-binding protein n=1 Tax=Larkinella humicola TaxID=2607654 RepID=A0A5N1JMD8_9BACT|nr:carbohydrate-binding protein [Larkinella humicola]KAA9357655.1 carbohydrate-binding protein [Larkinella humicola]